MESMQTRTDAFALGLNWLNPLGSWEAAARWNAIALDWMTRGWQQWLELSTVWPALESPGAAMNEVARTVDAIDVPASVIGPAGSGLARAAATDSAPAGSQKARNARALEAPQARGRRRDGEAARAKTPRRSTDRPAAKGASSRPAGKRTTRARR
jgi:hypothetical protein